MNIIINSNQVRNLLSEYKISTRHFYTNFNEEQNIRLTESNIQLLSCYYITYCRNNRGNCEIQTLTLEEKTCNRERIFKFELDLSVGIPKHIARMYALVLTEEDKMADQLTQVLYDLYRLFKENKISSVRTGPMTIEKQEKLIILDAAITVKKKEPKRQNILYFFWEESRKWLETVYKAPRRILMGEEKNQPIVSEN